MARSDQIARALAGLLGVVALGLAAATLTSPREPGEPGSGDGEGPGGMTPVEPGDGSSSTSIDPSLFLEVIAVIVAIALVLYAALYFARNPGHIKYAVAAALLFAALLAGLWYLVELIDPEMPTPEQDQGGLPDNDSGAGEGEDEGDGGDGSVTDGWNLPPWARLGAVGAVVLVGILLVYTASSRYRDSTATGADSTDADETAAIGAAASRAADRIEEAPAEDADNEVYRAWREMTDLLEVDRPETSTPREFADAAVAAGMGRGDVAELTELFEVVRYGDREPTASLEERAVAVFRRIEDEYDEEEEDAGDDGPTGLADTERGEFR